MKLSVETMILCLTIAMLPASTALAETGPGARIVKYLGYGSAIELSNDNVRVVLCPEVGGRVLEYSLHGKNVLFISQDEKDWTPGRKPASSAGRFDIGPELIVPQRQVLWSGEWTAKISGSRMTILKSQPDPGTGVQLQREFELAADSSRLSCTQTIINISDEVKEWCHWSRTFAVGQGICIIPTTPNSRFPNQYVMYEEGSLINMRPDDPGIRVREGMIEIFKTPRKPKLGFDSSAGVMAYVAPNDLLFVKRFKVDRDRVYNEAAGLTISVWYPNGDMVELEPIGPRERLAPGESASFTEVWWLGEARFPADSDQLDLTDLQLRIDRLK